MIIIDDDRIDWWFWYVEDIRTALEKYFFLLVFWLVDRPELTYKDNKHVLGYQKDTKFWEDLFLEKDFCKQNVELGLISRL